jgi:hypothetical protein
MAVGAVRRSRRPCRWRQLFTGWPENGGDESLSPLIDVRDHEEAVA